MNNNFDILIVITEKDFRRVKSQYHRLVANLPGRKIKFVGPKVLEEEVIALNEPQRAEFLDENDILPYDLVYDFMAEHMKDVLAGQIMPRGVVGWYYQQFLKMAYSNICQDEYYMTWDGDTIPCAPFSMFSESSGLPYFDMKNEFHEPYFETMGIILPGACKVIGKSFISEHMLFKRSFMLELIQAIESNEALSGNTFWEKIVSAIEPRKITDSSFSEFETYGTYVAVNHTMDYQLRNWHSFRMAGDFFDINTISDRDYQWLSKDFFAISFEKWAELREDHRNLFDNPEYQAKLSAKQMLQIAQEEFKSGYIEVWD